MLYKLDSAPILIILGEYDHLYPVEQNVHLFQQSLQKNPNASIWVVPESSHAGMAHHNEYENYVSVFIEKALKITSSP